MCVRESACRRRRRQSTDARAGTSIYTILIFEFVRHRRNDQHHGAHTACFSNRGELR